jgi:twitching motility two-component system response regulator PilH
VNGYDKEKVMSKKRVLVVDDSPTDLQMLSSILTNQGYDVLTAVDGEDAVDKASTALPPVVVLDIILPKKNGFQVCRQLKTTEATRGIKVILVSSKNQESDKFWGLKQGADEYIGKPFQDEELLAAVARQL